MQEDRKQLTAEQMNTATGGSLKAGRMLLRGTSYCKSCGEVITYIRGAYRCTNVDCENFNIPKTINDVNWY